MLTAFIGRERELAELARLRASTRLLTLHGPGGSGKTRLARALLGPDDRFVDLAGVAEDADVDVAVARALGVPDEPGRSAVDSTVAALGAAPVRVVLDNCEHVVAACAALTAELLGRCPGLRVLATSRERLDVPGEVVWPVPPLAAAEAAALFLDRARSVRPGYAPNAADDAAVATICAELDGLPLAVELAAARMRVLDPPAIAAGLGHALALLTEGGRTAPARQRSLRASLDWSHDLLPDAERDMLRRVAVFVVGFDLRAAHCVAGPDLTEHQTLDLIGALVDRSLLLADPAAGRFRLLEVVRQYATERLVDAGELAATRDRHRDHFLAVATASPEAAAVDFPNLRAAFAWSLEQGASDAALHLAGALYPVWRRGRRREGAAWLDAATAAASGAPALRARALALRSRLAIGIDPADADRIDAAVALARQAGDRAVLAEALVAGAGYLIRGPAAHRALLVEAAALAAELGDDRIALDAQAWLGFVDVYGGAPDVAVRHLDEVLAAWTGRGNAHVLLGVRALRDLALLLTGDVPAARADLESLVPEARAVGDRLLVGYASAFAAWAAAAGGDRSGADRARDDADALVDAWRGSAQEPMVRLGLGRAALVLGDPDRAVAEFEAGLAATRGAPGWAELLRAPLAEARRAPRTRPITGWSALTPAECQVARLVAEGLRNKEIADRLVISVRTVETHLSRVYAKLGVSTRVAVAAEAAHRGRG